MVGDEDHGALLDPRGDPLRDRLRDLLPLLPLRTSGVKRALVYGLARSGHRGGRGARAGRRRGRAGRPAARQRGRPVAARRCRRAREDRRAFPARRCSSPRRARRGIPVWSEIELGWRRWRRVRSSASPGRTGRRRRRSCSARSSARPAGRSAVAGNVGTPLTSVDAPETRGSCASCRNTATKRRSSSEPYTTSISSSPRKWPTVWILRSYWSDHTNGTGA